MEGFYPPDDVILAFCSNIYCLGADSFKELTEKDGRLRIPGSESIHLSFQRAWGIEPDLVLPLKKAILSGTRFFK